MAQITNGTIERGFKVVIDGITFDILDVLNNNMVDFQSIQNQINELKNSVIIKQVDKYVYIDKKQPEIKKQVNPYDGKRYKDEPENKRKYHSKYQTSQHFKPITLTESILYIKYNGGKTITLYGVNDPLSRQSGLKSTGTIYYDNLKGDNKKKVDLFLNNLGVTL